VTLDAGTIAQLVANGLAVVVLWLGLRSQTRQGEIYARTMVDLVAAIRTRCEDDAARCDTGRPTQPAATISQDRVR
jgi:hypothetical protein